MDDRRNFLFLNVGHFLDHLFMLIFATVAALVLVNEWGVSYSELIPYATPGFIAFGLFSLPAGWIADRWSREAMMAVFFVGAGIAAFATSFAQTPVQIAIGLFLSSGRTRDDRARRRYQGHGYCHQWCVGQHGCRQRRSADGRPD